MNTPDQTTSTVGGYVAVVSFAVMELANFGIVIPQSVALQAVGGAVAIVAIIHLLISHFNVSKLAGLKN